MGILGYSKILEVCLKIRYPSFPSFTTMFTIEVCSFGVKHPPIYHAFLWHGACDLAFIVAWTVVPKNHEKMLRL